MRYLIVIIIISLSLLIFICYAYQTISINSDAYDYPIKGGTAEWGKLSSHAEMLEVCQIPENILKEISTEGLVETVLNYPLSGDMYAYNSLQQGFEAITTQFNGLSELLKRDDAGEELLARYKAISMETKIKEERFILKLEYLETILSQEEIILGLSKTQKENLLKEAKKIMKQKGIYGFSLDSSKKLINACIKYS